jgi:hypothetical protein
MAERTDFSSFLRLFGKFNGIQVRLLKSQRNFLAAVPHAVPWNSSLIHQNLPAETRGFPPNPI